MSRIKDLNSSEEVSRLVCDEVDKALHPAWLYLCRWEDVSKKLSVVQPSAKTETRSSVQAPPEVLRLLRTCKVTALSASPDTGGLVIVPIKTNTITSGAALLLGEKKSEEPYTQTDRHLLTGIADAMSMVFENLWLKEQVHKGLRTPGGPGQARPRIDPAAEGVSRVSGLL